MRRQWLVAGRAFWVLLVLNGLVLLGLTIWVAWGLLQNPSPRVVQGLAETGLSPTLYGAFIIFIITLVYLVYFVVALLIFLRRPNDGFALFVATFLLNFGATNAYPLFPEFLQFYNHPPIWYDIPAQISALTSWPLLIPFLFIYPDGKFVPRWLWYFGAGGFMLTTSWGLFPSLFNDPSTPLGIFGAAAAIFFSCATLYGQIWRYRHYASPLQRQQTKWFLFALAIFFVFTVITFLSPVFAGPTNTSSAGTSIWADLGGNASTLNIIVIPIAVGIAILRYRLWDIDVLIRRTLTYAILSAFLALIYFCSIVALQRVFSTLTGVEQNEIVTVVSTLGIAALFVPLRNWIQAVIDQRFYRKKYDAQKVLADFAETVRDETDLEQLSARLIQVVQETMQPKSVSMWLRTGIRKGER